jgi:hypothetical protein
MSYTVTRSAVQEQEFHGRHTWPLQMTVASTDGCLVPAEIFVYHAGQQNGAYQGDVFECVASVHQLQELGTDPAVYAEETHGVDKDKRVPYYRTSVLLFHCRSAGEADDLYTSVMEDINDLINNFNCLQNLTTETVTQLL